MKEFSIGIIGFGFVGSAMFKSFENRGIKNSVYDKYKNLNSLNDILSTDIVFLCLPTPFCEIIKKYDFKELEEIIENLNKKKYRGLVVIKSTVEPETTSQFKNKFTELKICHNPEFLSAKTAFEDFDNQKFTIIGKTREKDFMILVDFYKKYYNEVEIIMVDSLESEIMKIACNSFYCVKIQFFNEIYDLCKKMNIEYDKVRDLMLIPNWINKTHTDVPGYDGELSYGGACFPKDSNALLNYMKRKKSFHSVLEKTIEERNIIKKSK